MNRERSALLVRWLDELVYLAETEDLVPEHAERIELGRDRLRASVRCCRGNPAIWSRPPPTTGSSSNLPRRASARGWCSMSEVALAGVRGFRQVDDVVWELPAAARADMTVPARVFADRELIGQIAADRPLEQLQNVATLPGITGAALAMPDIHQGYGFPVGGVAATEPPDGVVSPGGVGYDINCGVRMSWAITATPRVSRSAVCEKNRGAQQRVEDRYGLFSGRSSRG